MNIPGLTTFIGAWDQTEQGENFKSFKGIQFGKVNQRFQEATTFEASENSKNIFKVPYY